MHSQFPQKESKRGSHARTSGSVPEQKPHISGSKSSLICSNKQPIGIKSATFGLPMISEPSEAERLVFHSEFKRDPNFLLKFAEENFDFNTQKINLQKKKEQEVCEKKDHVKNLKRERLIQSHVANYMNNIKREQKRKAYNFINKAPIVIEPEFPCIKSGRRSCDSSIQGSLLGRYSSDLV
ncbi:unnamed protein product [Moneuplotes crassus]|uniref:Uncharacterized protein n=1 Tax=Euplotes crassus TaxID=5936 RepID=A0AAD2D803_EUPCR|nr:unnamed protein product [Moneuplotes crassus]